MPKKPKIPPTDTHAHCHWCEEWKVHDEFYRRVEKRNGSHIYYPCKECQRQARARTRAKKKELGLKDHNRLPRGGVREGDPDELKIRYCSNGDRCWWAVKMKSMGYDDGPQKLAKKSKFRVCHRCHEEKVKKKGMGGQKGTNTIQCVDKKTEIQEVV